MLVRYGSIFSSRRLYQVFGIKLSPAELGAVMEEFDKDGDGTVNCAEFLLTFFRVGFETRNKALQRYSNYFQSIPYPYANAKVIALTK